MELAVKFKITKREPGVMAHTCNPGIQKAEAEGSLWVQGSPRLHSEFYCSLSYKVRLLKEKSLKVKLLIIK